MKAEHDPLALHIFVSRRHYRNVNDTKSGKRREMMARLSFGYGLRAWLSRKPRRMAAPDGSSCETVNDCSAPIAFSQGTPAQRPELKNFPAPGVRHDFDYCHRVGCSAWLDRSSSGFELH
jgi:hypothetical protein